VAHVEIENVVQLEDVEKIMRLSTHHGLKLLRLLTEPLVALILRSLLVVSLHPQ